MTSPLRPFFVKSFDTLFTRHSLEWIDLALDAANEQRALIASDLAKKYRALSAEGIDDEILAGYVETDAAFLGTMLYRIEHAIFRRDPAHPALAFLAQLMRVRTGMEIYYSSEIGPRFMVMHGTGIVLGPRNRIGSDFTIYQGVTLGQRHQYSSHERMEIGDRCTIFAGAKLLGSMKLGDDVRVAANAVLLTDAETNATYAGVPAVKISR